MRTETRTVRIGEKVGPVHWSYNFRSHFDSMGCSEERKDERCERVTGWLRTIVEHLEAGKPIKATTYGGSPRCGIYPVVDVGMYDGWPYWRPTPSVLLQGPFGAEWATFSTITDIYPEPADVHP